MLRQPIDSSPCSRRDVHLLISLRSILRSLLKRKRISLILPSGCSKLLHREDDVERDDSSHENRIKDVQEHLMRDQVPIIALSILDRSKYRPNEDQDADSIQNEEVPPPRDARAVHSVLRASLETVLEDAAGDDEEAEVDDLQDQACYDEVLAGRSSVWFALG